MSIILSLIVFSILVLIHEFGHFLLAKKNGIGVTEFSLGMGPRIVSFEKGGTRYSWKLIPFGGSCMMVGEDTDENSEDSFNSKSVWARIAVVAAGPIFNFILAFVLAIVYIGMQGYDSSEVSYVSEGGAAAEAGIEEGDVLTEFDGHNIVIYRDYWINNYLNPITSTKAIKVKYTHNGKEKTASITPGKAYSMGIMYTADDSECKVTVSDDTPASESGLKTDDVITAVDGNEIKSGAELAEYMSKNPLDGSDVVILATSDGKAVEYTITPKQSGYTLGWDIGSYKKANPLQVIRYSFTELRYDTFATWSGLKLIFTGKASKDDVSGPVGIVKIVGDSYEQTKDYGVKYVFLQIAYLIILLSVNLGFVNLLPFPALDGGRLVFLLIEAVRGKPVPKDKEAIVHFVGMIILMILMVLILCNDITKFF